MDMSNEFDRILFLEHARSTAEASYANDPLDADNLTRWGGALLELSQCQSRPNSEKMIQAAIDKLEEAVSVNPGKHDALWCLGNAYTSNGFMIPDLNKAHCYFNKAIHYFQLASQLDPQNQLYQRSLEMTTKAPELHAQIHNLGLDELQDMGTGPSVSSSSTRSVNRSKNSDLKYDVLGWIILALGIVAWVGFAKSNLPPPK